jgi:serine/threonine-protein kinase HipA
MRRAIVLFKDEEAGILGKEAGLNEKQIGETFDLLTGGTAEVERLVEASFLNDTTKRTYLQNYRARLKQIIKH